MILRKIIIPLFSALFILSFFSAVADTGRDTATDLAKAQDRTRSVEDRLGAIRTMGQSGDERHSDPLLRMLRDKGEDRRVRAGLLREFRERYLRTSSAGRLFLSIYERYGPSLAALINRHDILKGLTRIALLPVLGLCILILHTGPLPLIAFSVALCVLVVYRVRRRKSLQEV